MKEGSGRRKYDKPFKEEAVRMVTESGRSVADEARGLGIMKIFCISGEGSIMKTLEAVFLGRRT